MRQALYMATFSATRANPVIRTFYTCLGARGTAMHKLLIRLNVAVRDLTPWRSPQTMPGT